MNFQFQNIGLIDNVIALLQDIDLCCIVIFVILLQLKRIINV